MSLKLRNERDVREEVFRKSFGNFGVRVRPPAFNLDFQIDAERGRGPPLVAG